MAISRKTCLLALACIVILISLSSTALGLSYEQELDLNESTSLLTEMRSVGSSVCIGIISEDYNLASLDMITGDTEWSVHLNPQSRGAVCDIAVSDNEQKLYAITSGYNSVNSIESVSGILLDSRELPTRPYSVEVDTIGNNVYLIVLSENSILVLDENNLQTTACAVVMPEGETSGYDYSTVTDTQYVTLMNPGRIASYKFTEQQGAVVADELVNSTGEMPFNCVEIDNQYVAVGCTDEGTVRIHNQLSGLQQVNLYSGLRCLSSIDFIDGKIILCSYHTVQDISAYQSGIMTIGPYSGISNTLYIDEAYFTNLIHTGLPNHVLIIDAGTMKGNTQADWPPGTLYQIDISNCTVVDSCVLEGANVFGAFNSATQKACIAEVFRNVIKLFTM